MKFRRVDAPAVRPLLEPPWPGVPSGGREFPKRENKMDASTPACEIETSPEIETWFAIGTVDGKPVTQQSFAIQGTWPADWWDTKKHPELWEIYVIPTIQQLRCEAAYRAHGENCSCHICSGEIDEPKISNA